jgi:CSLREA domain-containing protein
MKRIPLKTISAFPVRSMIVLAVLIAGAAFLFTLQPAHAATTYTVNSLADTDDTTCDAAPDCTLREAINAANRNPGADIINFSVNGIITTQDGFGILDDVTINGPGSNLLTVSGNDTGILFVVETPGTVTFSKLTISHGIGIFGSGGGISNRGGGTVNVNNCTLTNNSTTNDGGAIYNFQNGTVNVTDSILSNNTSGSRGGGIYNEGACTLNVTNSTLNNNSAAIQGGGIYNGGTATVDSSTISGNSTPAQGGGIYTGNMLSVFASTVSNNSADTGGGISNFNGTANVTNSTLSGNTANRGGAISTGFFAPMNVTSSTLSNNSAATQGGGIFNDTFANSNLHSSIVALNTAPSGSDLFSGAGSAFNSQGYNAIGTATDSNFVSAASDQVGVPATQLNLGALASNGGPTQTMALGTGSVAINTGDDAVTLPPLSLTTDQRGPGYARKSGTHVDAGAFEVQQRNAPTNKDQCKNGGWRNFDNPRTFKNQGDCIQFVNTGK